MKLWRIYQDFNDNYDTYDSAVVAAESEEEARQTHPGSVDDGWPAKVGPYTSWALPKHVGVVLIGEAVEGTAPGVILASFNAG